jgi:hypothetical protein
MIAVARTSYSEQMPLWGGRSRRIISQTGS